MPEEDEPIEVTEQEVSTLSPTDLERITVRSAEPVVVNRIQQQDGTVKHVTDFGGGSHWTVVHDINGRPLRCVYDKVRFEKLGSTIFVVPLSEST
jgi:hypothetical protein